MKLPLSLSLPLLFPILAGVDALPAADDRDDESLIEMHRGLLTDRELEQMRRSLQVGMGGGGGGGMGHDGQGGGGGGWGGDGAMMMGKVHGTIMFLFDNTDRIDRQVTILGNGTVVTTTTSDDPEVARALNDHVDEMVERLYDIGWPIRRWDPLFDAIYRNLDSLALKKTRLPNGVRAALFGQGECGRAITRAHAAAVSDFVKNGRVEAHRLHAKPSEC